MAITESGLSAEPSRRELLTRVGIRLDTVAVLAVALLIYVSGSFLIAEVAGVKRYLQVILILPLAVTAVSYFIVRPRRLLDPLIFFVIVRTGTEVALRGQWLYILDNLTTLLALIVLHCVPSRCLEKGARAVVWLAGILAAMGLLQWTLLFLFPDLGDYRLIVSREGVIESTVKHPIALLGLFGELEFSFLGHPVARLQSFAMEPSLNVVYFLIPAILALLVNTKSSVLLSMAMLLFCVLSFSGSAYLCLAFAALWWVLLRVVSLKFALSYGIILGLAAYLFVIEQVGFEPMLEGIAYIAQYGDFLGKTASLTERGAGAVVNMQVALSSPFGSSTLSDIAGPWLINTALGAGWLGVILLLAFLRKLARELELLNVGKRESTTWLASLLLLGTMSTVIVFSDYQMSNYAGLILLAFIYRTIHLRNQAAEARSGFAESSWKAAESVRQA